MSESRIEWTDRTWNPVTGCTPVSAGCANCYARIMARRFAGMNGYPEYPHHFDVTLRHDRLLDPFKWKKPQRVFVVSMGDLFHRDVPGRFIYHVFDVALKARHHTYQFLTKRAKRMARLTRDFCRDRGLKRLPAHMWGLVTAEDRENADERIPWLCHSLFQVRGVSCEPLLGEISHLSDYVRGFGRFEKSSGIDWVIAGGESGPGARPMEVEWARSLRDQCAEAGVPFLFKQWGRWLPFGQRGAWTYEESEYFQDLFDAGVPCVRLGDRRNYFSVGKKRAGDLLDHRRWAQFPGGNDEEK